MKILQLISSSGFYGAESVLVNLIVELRRMGHPCVVGVFENSENMNTEVADRSESLAFRVVRIPCRGKMDWKTVSRVRRIIEEEGVDLVHTHGYKADFYGLLTRRQTSVPVIATCHNWLKRSLATRAYGWLDRYLLRFFDGIAAVSNSVAHQLVDAGVRQEVRIIANGVAPPDTSAALPHEFRQAGRMVVGAVGRLSAEKGTIFLIEAARELCDAFPHVLFVQVGDGPMRDNLEARVRALGIERQFLFVGQRQDMTQIYRSFDVFVLSSLTEAMPMALLEAMAAGLPVVATRVGAVPEVIGDPSVGTLVEPGRSDVLAAAIRDLLVSKGKRNEVSANAKKRVEELFSASGMARKYVVLYQEILLRCGCLKNSVPVSSKTEERDAP